MDGRFGRFDELQAQLIICLLGFQCHEAAAKLLPSVASSKRDGREPQCRIRIHFDSVQAVLGWVPICEVSAACLQMCLWAGVLAFRWPLGTRTVSWRRFLM